MPEQTVHYLSTQLKVGDLVFIRIPIYLFLKVADTTGSWTNHVGIVVDLCKKEPIIAESTFPYSRYTNLKNFVKRSEIGRIGIHRLCNPLSVHQEKAIQVAAHRRLGIFYDMGFHLHSPRQFCSRFVREILEESVGIQVGEKETFAMLLARQPTVNLNFWRLWYLGRIPWERETVTPISVLQSSHLSVIYDGYGV